MRIDVITIFPQMFPPVLETGMLRVAREGSHVDVAVHDLRDYTIGRHRQVDDEPYGGGPGMVMMAEPFYAALTDVLGSEPNLLPGGTRTILMSARGKRLDHRLASSLAQEERLVVLCGRYEGVDARVADFVTDEISIGDYVLSGGEIGAMVVIDTVTRLQAGVLGASESLEEESFASGQLEYPHYTRPARWREAGVPPVLLSGDHRRIGEWRQEQSRLSTAVRRPDLCEESGHNKRNR